MLVRCPSYVAERRAVTPVDLAIGIIHWSTVLPGTDLLLVCNTKMEYDLQDLVGDTGNPYSSGSMRIHQLLTTTVSTPRNSPLAFCSSFYICLCLSLTADLPICLLPACPSLLMHRVIGLRNGRGWGRRETRRKPPNAGSPQRQPTSRPETSSGASRWSK